MDELLQERYQLSMERIRQICGEEDVKEPFCTFFHHEADFLIRMDELRQMVATHELQNMSLEKLRCHNRGLYEEILPEHYETCYGNPTCAVRLFGPEYGQILSFLYTEVRGMIVFAYEQQIWNMQILLELFLEIYHMFAQDAHPEVKHLKKSIYWYASDYAEIFMEQNVKKQIDPQMDFAVSIIRNADLSDLRYLYFFGEYITENEEKMADFLMHLPEEEVEKMARTFTEGYRMGFINGRKPLEKKRSVNIRYTLGFERVIKEAIRQFEEMGLQPVIYRSAVHSMQKSRHGRIGYYGAVPNPQFEFDHKNDAAIYLDADLAQRKLRALQQAYEANAKLAAEHGGPACLETFGEIPFVPRPCKEAITYTAEQQKLQIQYDNDAGQIVNRYIKGEERSFTIIAYPVVQIGDQFEEIFRETVKINTLDYKKYERIQQCLIDALDQGCRVRVKGMNDNRTDLTISLHALEDHNTQTNFENCVADVNIPVGEVFTSPVLQDTNGTLHVSQVYLNELNYMNLELQIRNGKVTDYLCDNFQDMDENRRYIKENILFQHETLPMGEFAIGTNTTAYVMAKKYGIAEKLPILIAEKMGPHFAFGDTCYSWQEETKVYNPDGKEIIARDNEISILRKKDLSKAYFGCHTDITIPYDELGSILVEKADGTTIALLSNGKFVLNGTEELNEPFEHLKKDGGQQK